MYQTYWCQFLVTGEGVKEDDDAINLSGESSVYLSRMSSVITVQTEKIQEEWPFYNDLHGLSTMTCMAFGLFQPNLLQCFPSAVARQTVVALRMITLDEEDDQAQVAGPHDADTSNRDSSEFDESGGWWGAWGWKPKPEEEDDEVESKKP